MPLHPSSRAVGHPALERFEAHFGTRVRVTPRGAHTWVAELHDLYTPDSFAFRVSTTGDSENDALSRLSQLLAEIAEES